MNWLSFVVGVLVGWLIEWLIDVFYWRRRRAQTDESGQLLGNRLANAQAEVEQLRAELARRQGTDSQLAECEAGRSKQSAEIQRLTAELAALRAEGEAWREPSEAPTAAERAEGGVPHFMAQAEAAPDAAAEDAEDAVSSIAQRAGSTLASLGEPARVAGGQAGGPLSEDDLTVIEGIGPKIAAVLRDAGLATFSQLADSAVEQLRATLGQAGPRFSLANPETWPEQARLAAAGAWEDLKELQDALRGGLRRR